MVVCTGFYNVNVWSVGREVSPVICVVYDTKRGSTEKIAGYIAEKIAAGGEDVRVCRVSECKDVSQCDVVVVGAPVYYESPLRSVVAWLESHGDDVKDKDVCLFVVCMAQMFGHPLKSYVYKRYLGILRKALGREPTCQGDIMGYVLKEGQRTKGEAYAFAESVLTAICRKK